MKKTMVAVSVLVVAVLAFGTVSSALAAGPSQGGSENGNIESRSIVRTEIRQDYAWGDGVPEDRNLLLNREINLDGLLDDLIHEKLALAFGLLPSELMDRLDDGETIVDIARSLGMDDEAIEELMADVRIEVLSDAVWLGLITQEQSDWLASSGFGNPSLETSLVCLAE